MDNDFINFIIQKYDQRLITFVHDKLLPAEINSLTEEQYLILLSEFHDVWKVKLLSDYTYPAIDVLLSKILEYMFLAVKRKC